MLAVALFLPSLRTLRIERTDTLKIFLSIPKAAINTIYNRVNGEDEVKEIDDEAIEDKIDVDVYGVESRDSLPILKQLLIRYLTVLGNYFNSFHILIFKSNRLFACCYNVSC